MLQGLRYLYYLCYRCESGQEILLNRNVRSIFPLVYENHIGDSEVMYQCKRVELSLTKDGWRGNVESLLSKEFQGM